MFPEERRARLDKKKTMENSNGTWDDIRILGLRDW